MKFRYLYVLPIAVLALTACDEIETSDAKPVENPQLPEITETDFSVTPDDDLTGLMNLDLLNAETDDASSYMLPVYTINVLTEDLPEGYELSGGLQFSTTNDFEQVFNVSNVEVENGVASVPLSNLLETRGAMFGPNDPREYTIYYRIPVYVTVDGGQYKIGNKDYYFCAGNSFEQEGVDPGYIVEDTYYLLGPDGSDLSSAVEFEHSGYNVYDDTVFSVTVKFENGDSSWLVVPESVYEAAQGGSLNKSLCYGPADAEALEGVLNIGGQEGKVEGGKKYAFSIDLKQLTYSIREIADFDYLYTPGNSNGWSQTASQMLSTGDYVTYTGFAYLNGQFKFTSAPNWDGQNFGNATSADLEDPEYEGGLSTSGGNLNAAQDLYWCNVNIDEMTYKLTQITSVSMIGEFNGWAGDEEMTSDDYLIWTGTLNADGNGWKFRFNNDWEINLGGSETDLVINGDNLVNDPGTYTVTLDLSKLPYSCTVVAK